LIYGVQYRISSNKLLVNYSQNINLQTLNKARIMRWHFT